jgi:sugar lactone lactonase YvrE
VDAAGNLYIADTYNQRIRKVGADGTISTVAGNGIPAWSGDGGPAASASLYYPSGIAVDRNGNVYIADSGNNRIRKVAAKGTISTVAGNGTPGYSGDGEPATNAKMMNPVGVVVDAAGNFYIADSGNNRIRKVTANGTISTIAGNGIPGYSGDGRPATNASFYYPSSVALDASGNLFIADAYNQLILEMTGQGR